ncbi:hypothetical protein BVY02_01030 [bacterium J17]|nr:hypothetical protein BVY02_01030 [bacterium J17]
MSYGMWVASSGGLSENRRLELIAHNLANVNTVGYKAERLTTSAQDFGDTLAKKMEHGGAAANTIEQTPGVVNINTFTDFSAGPVSNTGNPLNVALRQDNQFFVVSDPEGDSYTRAGNFTLDAERNIVTADGAPVQGDGGPLTLPPGASARIQSDGTVMVDGQVIGRIKVVEFQEDQLVNLKRAEGVRFKAAGDTQPQTVPADLVTSSVELPNVSVVEAMVEMISAQRSFEAYTKTVQTMDQLTDTAIRNTRTTA